VGATTFEEAEVPAATIRVTDETAFRGKRSLKFSDAPGQKATYNPHLFWRPGFSDGTLVGRFALRHEPNAVLFHEWRDDASPYHAGPSLRVAGDGQLTAGGKPLVKLEPSKWVRIEITCRLGASANGTWDLAVLGPGRVPARRFPNLPCASPDFRSLHWFGFVADGQETATFYLDDVSLGPHPVPLP
jgi:hypothetical protein